MKEVSMKRLFFLSATVATALLAGCADTEGGYYHASGGVSAVGYDGFYDDYYGPFYDGYWAPDGFFYYSLGARRPFLRDEGHHFRHEAGDGFHAIHGHQHMD